MRRDVYLVADLAHLVRRPFRALPLIEERRRLRDGVLALALAVVLPALVQELGALAPYRSPASLPALSEEAASLTDLFARWSYQERFRLPAYGVVAGLVLWLLAAALIHGVARTLKGRGTFSGYLTLVGYVAFIGVISVPFALANALVRIASNTNAGGQLGALLVLLTIGIFAWQNVLLVIAAQAHYSISMERAATAVLGPIGFLIVLAVALLILAAILAIVIQPVALR